MGRWKPAIFIDAAMHAREWIAPSTAVYIIDHVSTWRLKASVGFAEKAVVDLYSKIVDARPLGLIFFIYIQYLENFVEW